MTTLALTFDDGPDPVWTARLLDELERLGAHATFFPLAARAAASPRLIERMLSGGHAVGVHCDAHVRHSQRDRAAVERDTDRALAQLRSVGAEPALWRTPWGDRAEFTEEVAAQRRLRLVGWSVDTHDWRGDSADEMLAATQDSLVGGAVVLAHDGIGPGALRNDTEQTVRYAALAAEHARHTGLELGALA